MSRRYLSITLLRYGLLFLILSITALALFIPIYRLPHHIFIDYNEGWMAYFSVFAITKTPLYQSLDSLILNNYPPLFFYISGWSGVLLGDMIIAGRLLALSGLFLSMMMVALITHRFTQSVFLSISGAAFLGSIMGMFHSDYVGMNDPQWLAHGIMLTGLLIFFRCGEKKALLYTSAAIMLLAGFMKHSLLPVPAAVTLWLYFHDRKRFYHWLRFIIPALGIAFVFLYAAFGENFFLDVFRSPRTYHIGKLIRLGIWLRPLSVFIATAFLLFVVFFKEREVQLLMIYVLVSIVWGAYTLGAGGVYYNAIFDIIISLVIAAMISVHRFSGRIQTLFPGFENGRGIVVGLMILFTPLLLEVPHQTYTIKEFVKRFDQEKRETEDDIAFVASFSDPVMCENLALNYWAGKQFTFDFFSVGQKLKTKTMPSTVITELIMNKTFSLIQINDQSGHTYLLPEEILMSIRENYRSVRKSDVSGVLLTPKP